MPEVITRFAPSPTGHLHVGGARTALFCWAWARRHKGTFILRIEDTDQARSTDEAARGILEDLAWINIPWDEGPPYENLGGDPRNVGPFHQADRLDLYKKAVQQLIDADRAYPAFDTTEELEAMRADAESRKETFKYRRAPDYDRDAALKRMQSEDHVIRFRALDEPIVVPDVVIGGDKGVTFEAGELEDFVILKRDGFPTYHMAVVVDDEGMGVTHVLRGQEHLTNTPKHVALQQALGYRTPVYAHLSVIENPGGGKMSKRDRDKAARAACKDAGLTECPVPTIDPDLFKGWLGDKKRQLAPDQLIDLAGALNFELPAISVEDFRAAGYLPDVLCNYLALLGWNPGEKQDDGSDLERFDMNYLAEHFSLERIGKKPGKFDRAKLTSFNADTIQQDLTDDQFAALWRDWLERYDAETLIALGNNLAAAARAARPRTRTLRDAADAVRFLITTADAIEYDEKAVAKFLKKGDPSGLDLLAGFEQHLAAVDPFGADTIEAAVKNYCESKDLGMGKLAQPLRVAMTGSGVSPGLGETLALIGKDESLARLRRCVSVHT